MACLRDLPGAASKLQLFEADLLETGSFDACVSGADVVFHTASPFVTSNISNPHEELHKPALEGTRHVFSSIARAMAAGGSPPRVVLTSSVAAIMGKPTDKATCFYEDDWNGSSEAEGAQLAHACASTIHAPFTYQPATRASSAPPCPPPCHPAT